MPKSTKTQQPKDEKSTQFLCFIENTFSNMPLDLKFFAVSMTPNGITKNSKSETKYQYRDYETSDKRCISNIADCNIQSNNKINKRPLKLNLKKIEKQKITKIKINKNKKLKGSVRRL
jgi:hypothetical protein